MFLLMSYKFKSNLKEKFLDVQKGDNDMKLANDLFQ